MSQGQSSASDNGEITLAIQFQGLSISVQGPASRALEFVQHLSPEPEAEPTTSVDFTLDCPEQYLALAAKLSAASSHSPIERVQRAWRAGLYARAALAGDLSERSVAVVELDLPSTYFVVLQGRGVTETKVLRNRKEFLDLSKAQSGPPFVGHGFPSETETRVFIAGAGRAARHGA
eukprot:s568_g7.t1